MIRKQRASNEAGIGRKKIVVFTDLDGSLLDHDNYSYEAARPSLRRIKRLGIPLIMTTSKTRKEVEMLQKELEVRDPFICENGGAVFFPVNGESGKGTGNEPHYRIVQLGTSYDEIRIFIDRVKRLFHIRGFGDLAAEEIARFAGLPLEKARLAKMREFTEPFILGREECLGDLKRMAAKAGLSITRGSRFFHLTGRGQNKGKAVEIIKSYYKKNDGDILAIGIGDSANDMPMFKHVDIAVLIPHPDGTYEGMDRGYDSRIWRAEHPGSTGWNEVMEMILDRIESKDSAG